MTERICAILLANFLFFFKTITYNYVSDDIPVYQNPPKYKNKLQRIYLQFKGVLKINASEEHLMNIIIHSFVCVGIYLGFGADNFSFWAALLFAFNPINNQGSVWLSGRPYTLPALTLVWSLVFPYLAPVFLLLTGFLTLGFVVPIILIGSPYPWIGFFIPLIWMFHVKRFTKDVTNKVKTETFTEDKEIKWEKIVVVVKTFGFYLSHALIPFKTTFYHSFLQSMSASGKDRAYSMKCRFFWFGLLSLGFIGYYFTLPWTMASFSLLWWCLGIAPFLNFFRCHQEISERYAYLPTIGIMYFLAYAIPEWSPIFLTMYSTKLWFYMDCYQDDFYLAETAAIYSPDSWFAWHVKGHKRWQAQSYHEAAIMWTMARRISPKEFKILFNLATICKLGGHDKEAEVWLKEAQKNIPRGQEEFAEQIISEWKKGKTAVLL